MQKLRQLWPYMAMIAVVCLFFPVSGFGQGGYAQGGPFPVFKYVGGSAQPASGATITVCAATAVLVANPPGSPICPSQENDANCCFSDLGLTQRLNGGQPFPADSRGNVAFTAVPGAYQLSVTGSGILSYTEVVSVPCVPGNSAQCGAFTNAANNWSAQQNLNGGATASSLTVSGTLNANGGGALNGTFTGPTTLSNVPSQVAGKVNNIIYIDGVTNATLSAYLASPTANTTVIVTSNQTLSTDITVAVVGLKITCENGAVITYTATGRLNFSKDRDGIEGCDLVGAGVGVPGLQLATFYGGNNQFFRKNRYSGFGPTGSNGIVNPNDGFGTAANYFEFSGNSTQPTGNGDWDLYINACCTSATTMTGYRVENNDIGEFIAHATSATTIINKVVSVGNHFHAGQNSKTEFCEEIGPFGGTSVNDVSSTGNTCIMTSAADGGYSLAGPMNYASETGDNYNGNGFNPLVAAFEHVMINNSSITGNVANYGVFGSSTGGPFTCDRCSNSSFTGNIMNGGCTQTGCSGMHIIVANTTNPAANNNTVNDNVIIFPAAGAGKGIWHQCNAVGATCTGNTISGNLIKSDGTAGSQGINIENDTGTTTNVLITGNSILGPATGIVNGGTVTNTTILPNRNTGATLLTDSGTGTLIQSVVIKKGSGAGNYTNATTSYTVADSTNLCYTITIPKGWNLGISASGGLATATAAVVAQAALTDNAACSTANAGVLVETPPIQGAAIGVADGFSLNWTIAGDGNAHNIALQFKTSNAADTASLINSSATIVPTMNFTLTPSN